MAIKYRYLTENGFIETLSLDDIPEGLSYEPIEFSEVEEYDPHNAAQLSIGKGREIAEYMLLELNARAKAYKQATGVAVGSGLIDLNSKLESYLNKGALEPDAINEIQVIVNSGQVDNFLDVYADALVRIDNFLGVE